MARWITIILDVHEVFHIEFQHLFFNKSEGNFAIKNGFKWKNIRTVILEDVTINLAFSNTFFHKKASVNEDKMSLSLPLYLE